MAHPFDALAKDQAKWSQETFGRDTDRGPIGSLRHLQKEAVEAIEAIPLGYFESEMADCLLLVLDAARRGGMSPLDLVRAAAAKMEINKQREWPVTAPDQPSEHLQ